MKFGHDFTLRELVEGNDAVFIGDCAVEVVPLTVPGAHLKGVYQGLTFLIQKNTPASLDLAPIEVKDRQVIVLGAGDTAMDCLRTASAAGRATVMPLSTR